MMFVVRTGGAAQSGRPDDAAIRIALQRQTPSILPDSDGQTDLFCIGDEAAMDRLRAAGWQVIPLRDGWYADDTGGGVAIWGQGLYWEIRDAPLSVKEAVGPARDAADVDGPAAETLDVRKGIFGV